MNSRRNFLRAGVSVLAASCGGLSSARIAMAASNNSAPRQSRPLNILIVGGSGFVGSHHAIVAHERGHVVTALGRTGKTHHRVDLPSGIEMAAGDVWGDLNVVKGRSWDAVIDCAQFAPQSVRNIGKALQGRVGRYILISTVSTYERRAGDLDESSPQLKFDDPVDPYSLRGPNRDLQYGSLKVLCEHETKAQFPERSLIVRPGVVVGPNHAAGFLDFWISRMERGGEIVVPGDPLARVQLIDARDLAQWTIRMVEAGETGTYNITGPVMPLTNGELMGALRSQFSTPTQLTWIPSQWLIEQKIEAHTGPLFWTKDPQSTGPNEHWVSNRVSSAKAYAKGLSCRSLATTLVDTIASFHTTTAEQRQPFYTGWSTELEQKTLALWRTTQGGKLTMLANGIRHN